MLVCIFVRLYYLTAGQKSPCKQAVDAPVFLTKNGRGKYFIVDMEEYEMTKATIKLMSQLAKGEASVKEGGWIDGDDVQDFYDVQLECNRKYDNSF